ncbi:hypothetical protein [Parabacteroides sp.]
MVGVIGKVGGAAVEIHRAVGYPADAVKGAGHVIAAVQHDAVFDNEDAHTVAGGKRGDGAVGGDGDGSPDVSGGDEVSGNRLDRNGDAAR